MEKFSEFLVNNYIWFLVVTLILVFALIGYIVDNKNKTKKEQKNEPIVKKSREEIAKEEIKNVEGKTINDAVKVNANLETSIIEEQKKEDYDQPLIVEEENSKKEFIEETKSK